MSSLRSSKKIQALKDNSVIVNLKDIAPFLPIQIRALQLQIALLLSKINLLLLEIKAPDGTSYTFRQSHNEKKIAFFKIGIVGLSILGTLLILAYLTPYSPSSPQVTLKHPTNKHVIEKELADLTQKTRCSQTHSIAM